MWDIRNLRQFCDELWHSELCVLIPGKVLSSSLPYCITIEGDENSTFTHIVTESILDN